MVRFQRGYLIYFFKTIINMDFFEKYLLVCKTWCKIVLPFFLNIFFKYHKGYKRGFYKKIIIFLKDSSTCIS